MLSIPLNTPVPKENLDTSILPSDLHRGRYLKPNKCAFEQVYMDLKPKKPKSLSGRRSDRRPTNVEEKTQNKFLIYLLSQKDKDTTEKTQKKCTLKEGNLSRYLGNWNKQKAEKSRGIFSSI